VARKTKATVRVSVARSVVTIAGAWAIIVRIVGGYTPRRSRLARAKAVEKVGKVVEKEAAEPKSGDPP